MKRVTFKLITMASFCLLLFSLYLNFLYKESSSEFAPVHNKTPDSTATAKQLSQNHNLKSVSERN